MPGSLYSWSKTPGSNATADPQITWSEGQLPSTINDSSRQEMARVAEFRDDITGALALTGTDTLTVTANSGFDTLATGRLITAKVANTNSSTTVTLNVNGLGAKRVKVVGRSGEADPVVGDIRQNMFATFRYDAAANAAAGAWILESPASYLIGTDVQAYRAEIGLVSLSASNIASASTTDIAAATGDFVLITGTTTITAFGTAPAGASRILRFNGALTLTHNGTSLILPTGANITTAANDIAHFRSLGSGNWICVGYMRADGTSVDPELAALGGLTSAANKVPYFTGSGTAAAADFTTTGRAIVAASITTDQLLYGNGANTVTTASLTTTGRALIAASVTTDQLLYGNGANTVTTTALTSAARDLLDDTTASAMRTTLGLTGVATLTYVAPTTYNPAADFITHGDLSVSYSSRDGIYTRIGDIVFINIAFTTSTWAYTTSSGNLTISLPVAAASGYNSALTVQTHSVTSPDYTTNRTWIVGAAVGGQSYLVLRQGGDAVASTTLTTAAFASGTNWSIEISGWYRV